MSNGIPGTGGWFVRRGKNSFGPYSWDQVVEHARAGRIGKSDMLFDPSAGAWAKAPAVASLFGPGGAAAGSAVGLSAAAKAAAILVAVLAVGLAAALMVVVDTGPMWSLAGLTPSDYIENSVNQVIDQANHPEQQTASAALPPEGVCYKGTFDSVEAESATKNLTYSDTCYLWVYTGENGTQAKFSYGDGLVDGWPGTQSTVPPSGLWGSYTFTNPRSLVEIVEIRAQLSEATARGTIKNTTRIGSFKEGTFSAQRIPYEEYRAAVID
jgi:hypothetical protein